jgi:hypothetical protein
MLVYGYTRLASTTDIAAPSEPVAGERPDVIERVAQRKHAGALTRP